MRQTDRMLERRWGVFNHFLYEDDPESGAPRDWNEMVNGFDVDRIAKSLHEIGAGWYFVTIMQGRKYMIAPNATFDAIAGTKPGEACAQRDLVSDLAEALAPYDIDLCLYFTGDGPYKDREIGERFGFTEPRENISMEFVKRWSAVLEEYTVRYGSRVKAWWLDGMYGHSFGYTDELMEPYHAAILKGNPDALTAFNSGVWPELRKWYRNEEITAGEFNDFRYVPTGRYYDGAQAFLLIPLGISDGPEEYGRWRRPGCRVPRGELQEYLGRVNAAGGILTIDTMIYPDRSWDPQQAELLRGL